MADKLIPYSVVSRGGVFSYRLKGWKSGVYRSLGIRDDGSKAAEKQAWAAAADEFRKSDEVRTGAILLRSYAERFYGDDCPHVAELEAEGKSITDRSKEDLRTIVQRDLLAKKTNSKKTATKERRELTIMAKKVRDITRSDVANAKAEIVKVHGQTNSAQKAFQTLRTILRTAYQNEMIPVDPLLRVKPIKFQYEGRNEFTVEQTEAFFKRENWASDLAYAVFRTAYLTGMRRGEVLALTWEQIKGDTLLIDRAWKDRHNTEIGLPKWGKVRENVVTTALREHLDWWKQQDPFVHGGLVFRGMGTEALGNTWWLKNFRYALKKAGITGVVPHSLRHTMATDLSGAGVSPDVIRGALGWTDDKVRQRYTHMKADRQKDSMEEAVKSIVGR